MEIGYKLSSEEHGPNELVRFARMAEEHGFGFAMISDPARQTRLPLFYHALDNGMYQPAGEMIFGAMSQQFTSMSGMPELMDLASGISPARLALD